MVTILWGREGGRTVCIRTGVVCWLKGKPEEGNRRLNKRVRNKFSTTSVNNRSQYRMDTPQKENPEAKESTFQNCDRTRLFLWGKGGKKTGGSFEAKHIKKQRGLWKRMG